MDYFRRAQAQFDIDEFPSDDNNQEALTIYEFTIKDTYGNEINFERFKDKIVLIVNIASNCGLASNQFKKLAILKAKYEERGLIILMFPCNQFAGQMPHDNGEPMMCNLRECNADIGIVFEKINVNGPNAHSFYTYLKSRQPGRMGRSIKWNFTKFLVDREGYPVARYVPTTDPMDIAKDIERLI